MGGGGGRNSSGSRPSGNGGLGHPHPEIRGGGVGARPHKNIFWPWSKNKGREGGGGRCGPLPWIRHWVR